jgi:hypothetical protein
LIGSIKLIRLNPLNLLKNFSPIWHF